MKIKSDFVTNSSSTCYVMSVTEDDIEPLKKLLKQIELDAEYINEGVGIDDLIKTMPELKNYTCDSTYDWATRARGEKFEFNAINESTYCELAKIIIKEKNIVAIVRMDYGANYSLKDDEEWKDKIRSIWG